MRFLGIITVLLFVLLAGCGLTHRTSLQQTNRQSIPKQEAEHPQTKGAGFSYWDYYCDASGHYEFIYDAEGVLENVKFECDFGKYKANIVVRAKNESLSILNEKNDLLPWDDYENTLKWPENYAYDELFWLNDITVTQYYPQAQKDKDLKNWDMILKVAKGRDTTGPRPFDHFK